MRKISFLIITIIIGLYLVFLVPFSKFLVVDSARLDQMNKCISDLQIPCRWTPDLSKGYGSPLFNYLPPLPYYFGGLVFLLSRNLLFSTKVMGITALVGSFLFLYLLSKNFLSPNKAIWIAFLGSLIPFILNLALGGTVGKMWGWMLLPSIMWLLIRLKRKVNTLNVLALALSIALLLISYDLSWLILILLITFLMVIIFKKEKRKFVIYSIYAIILSMLLSSFYLLPKAVESNLIHPNSKYADYLPIFATEIPKRENREKLQILTGQSEIEDFKYGSNYFSFKTQTNTHTIIRILQHYFPNWSVYIDNKKTNVEYRNNSLGIMTIILGEGNHSVEGKFYNTPVRIVANFMTLLGFTIIICLFLINFKKFRQWLLYYRKGIN